MSSEILQQVQHALDTMYSNAPRDNKMEATLFLETFQKSKEAWETVHHILESPNNIQLQIFAAQTLRSKVTYDLNQLPESSYEQLKDSTIHLLQLFPLKSQRLIRTQISIALSQLSLQFLNWQDALEEVIHKLSSTPEIVTSCLLDFLKILPEELSDVKKSSLTDEEFNLRTTLLISNNVERVLLMLKELADSNTTNNEYLTSQILNCLNNWIKECPVQSILQVNSLTSLIFLSLSNDETFDTAIECLCTIIRETRDIDDYALIDALYIQLIELNKFFITSHPEKLQDHETFQGLARLYVEAGEAWHILIVKNSKHFKPLVLILLEVCKYEEDLDVVKYTFPFWDFIKQLLTLSKFEQSRIEFMDVFTDLIRVIIKHLTYPVNADENASLFDDKEQEDKFKDFRYEMGDVLKGCCAVVGATRALGIPFQQIQHIIDNPQTSSWQHLEAPLFSMRTMAKEVSLRERTILPSIMTYLVQLPEHPKIRYAATLVLGRYSQWTFKNQEFLEPQMTYIIKGFEIVKAAGTSAEAKKANIDIIMATSRALMYFCQDCSTLLVNYLEQLYMLYGEIRDSLDTESHLELVDGLAHVISQVPIENLYKTTDMFISPTIDSIISSAAQQGNEDILADQVEVLTTFIKVLKCNDFEKQEYPAATLFKEKVWKVCVELLKKYGSSIHVSERVCKLIKSGIQSYSTYLNDILGEMAEVLHEGFKGYNYGCYLWVSGHLIREYGDEYTSDQIKESVYQFAMTQCFTFFDKTLNGGDIRDIPDVIGDFFRMVSDLLIFFPLKITSDFSMVKNIMGVLIMTMNVVNEIDPLTTCVHFLIDYVSWGLPSPPISLFDSDPVPIQEAIKKFLQQENNWGQIMTEVINGVIFKFPNDVQQDANDLVLKMLVVGESEFTISIFKQIISNLPNVDHKEIEKLIGVISVALPNKDNRRIRTSFKDFVNWYSRKNITPRTGF